MLPVITIMPRFERCPCGCQLVRKPGQRIQRVAHHVAARAMADLLAVDREVRLCDEIEAFASR